MSYIMHRVFCATSDDLEAERQAFHDALGIVNESLAMANGILFVPVSIPVNMADKRLFQPAVDDNIRSCRYYIQVFGSYPWPSHRDFAPDYALALSCAANPALPMCEVAALVRNSAPKQDPDASVFHAHRVREYSTIEEFTGCCKELLTLWLETIVSDELPR
jgi:hypothetical protein